MFEYFVLDDTYDFLINKFGEEWENFKIGKLEQSSKTLFKICQLDDP